MEAMVLIGGFLYIAVVGYVVIDRLGRFLDKGGISPYWDEEEEHLAQMKKTEPRPLSLCSVLFYASFYTSFFASFYASSYTLSYFPGSAVHMDSLLPAAASQPPSPMHKSA